jgi:hypothetical protein
MICHPDNAIWPTGTVLTVPVDSDDPTEEEAAALLDEEIALSFGWTTLQSLSAYQIAICTTTVRPCKRACVPRVYQIAPVLWGAPQAPFWPMVTNGVWTNIWCGHGSGCGCSRIRQVVLPGPVGGIVAVTVDGVDLDPDQYRLDNGNLLVRQDGEDWPLCQDMNLPAGEENTWSVTYYHGATADLEVRAAAGTLAAEYLSARRDGTCRLPLGTVNLIRQGISIEVQNNFFTAGTTGILEVDTVIQRFNPYGQRMPSRSWSPDRNRGRVTTIDVE